MKEQNKISVAGKEKEGKEEEGSRYGRQQPQRSDPRGLEGSWDFFQRSQRVVVLETNTKQVDRILSDKEYETRQ